MPLKAAPHERAGQPRTRNDGAAHSSMLFRLCGRHKKSTAGKTAKEGFSMTKNKFFMMGTLAMMLAFGLVLAGCENDADDGGSNHDSALIGKWYHTQDYADENNNDRLAYEFQEDGKFLMASSEREMTWTGSGGKITISYEGEDICTADYTIEETTLTISNASCHI
jgi:hypothetical protein